MQSKARPLSSELRDLLTVADDVGDVAGCVQDRAESTYIVSAPPLPIDPELLERVRSLLVDASFDGPLPAIRDGHRVLSLPAPVMVRFAQHPRPGRWVPNARWRVEEEPPRGIEDAYLRGKVIEQSPVLLELVNQMASSSQG